MYKIGGKLKFNYSAFASLTNSLIKPINCNINMPKKGKAPIMATLLFKGSLFCTNNTKAHNPNANDQQYKLHG